MSNTHENGGTSNENSGTGSPAGTQRPRDAATLIIIDRSTGLPRILMGRRRPEQVFMPNKYVFPGGRVDTEDRSVEAATDLHADEIARLMVAMKGPSPSETRARALALAAIRETFEESGILIGVEDTAAEATAPPHNPASHNGWPRFLSHQIRPTLAPLRFLARAITPPGRPRRYDTRFFCVDASVIAKTIDERDDELRDLDWFTLEELRQLDLPNITRAIVEDLADRLEHPDGAQCPVPFYYFKAGSFERELISL